MKTIIAVTLFVLCSCDGCITGPDPFAAEFFVSDSSGVVVTLVQKYGPDIIDTCTAVSLDDNHIYLTHRDSPSGVFQRDNFSIKQVGRLR